VAASILPESLVAAEHPWKALGTLALWRVVVSGIVLATSLLLGSPALGRFSSAGGSDATLLLVAYFFLALAGLAAAWGIRRHFHFQLGAQLAIDILVATVLVVLGGGMRSEFVLLYLVPIAGASLMLQTLVAFFICASAVLALLADGFVRSLGEAGSDPQLYQTGLYGAALFGLTALLRLLSMRLARQEGLARSRGRDLRAQLEINRLVIAQMDQGVVVVDALTRVRANNLAARLLLGLGRDARLTGQRLSDMPSLAPLAEEFLRWLSDDSRPTGWSDQIVPLRLPGDSAPGAVARVVRVRFARPPSAVSGEFVMFLEDLRELENRAQQLKLAAMGRLTASIAHEIRNPLAAISHAGQLLAEEARDAGQARLAAIVRENTLRLDRLVDDVLRAARRDPPLVDDFDLAEFVAAWLAEFSRDRALAADTIRLHAPPSLRIRFEQGHLRQILFNLVDNALRHASGRPACVEIRIEPAQAPEGRARLRVIDDGAGIPDTDRAAIFEPFFTTRSKGTGLGLFLAREFCIANSAELSYDLVPDPEAGPGDRRFGFVIRFAPVSHLEPDPSETIDTIPGPGMAGDARLIARMMGTAQRT
jgi:two-component system sensor histidine kinase PilS (NtrC family)